jgi:nucleoside-diphosphate-sugar epimerase
MMTDALIGHTGFVGSNLAAQHRFHTWFNSKNIEAIRGHRFELLVISGMPAAKWIANRDPASDRATLNRLWNCVSTCRADTVVVVSTVDVYPATVEVDEDTLIVPMYQQPYGENRLRLERLAARHFPRVLSVRLPALFGPGLKKNAVYDLLHDNAVHKIPSGGVFQFYNLEHLWHDIGTALAAGLEVVNFATEPVSMQEVAAEAFGIHFTNDPGGFPPHYDVRTRHAAIFGGRNGYLQPRGQVLGELRAFVAAQRNGRRLGAAA